VNDRYDRRMRDAMDHVHDQWGGLRPDLDVEAIHVVGRITRIARIVQRQSDELLRARGISRADFDLLAALVRRDVPSSPTQLADETLLSAPAITKRIRVLTAAGLVGRLDNPDDQRGYFVIPTPAGRAVLDAALGPQLAAERALLADLGPEARALLGDGLRALLVGLETGQRRMVTGFDQRDADV
jgi:DNA-binding MarR family transcriptional regulator